MVLLVDESHNYWGIRVRQYGTRGSVSPALIGPRKHDMHGEALACHTRSTGHIYALACAASLCFVAPAGMMSSPAQVGLETCGFHVRKSYD